MSEYQYYEFRAVDRPLTPEQMNELRALSSRATITPRSFSNTYNYGDFRGNPRKLMESHYDAHIYVSNFGTSTFMLRLPRTVLPEATLARYATGDGLEWWITDEFTILAWGLNGDPPDEWVEGEGWMDQLLPIRDELVRGDYRSLYIGWLAAIGNESYSDEDDEHNEEFENEEFENEEFENEEFENEEFEDDEDTSDLEDEEDDGGRGTSGTEPPVPTGLGHLTSAQSALAEFLGVDGDLIAAAAQASPEVPANQVSQQNVADWVARLPEQEVRSLIVRLIQDTSARVQTELQSRYYRTLTEPTVRSGAGAGRRGRTAAELLAMAEQTARERKRQEQEERQRKRRAQLAALVPRLSELWATVNALAEEQKASSYDKVCTLLVDMRDAYAQTGRHSDFDAEFARFLGQQSHRTALVRKLKEARLTS